MQEIISLSKKDFQEILRILYDKLLTQGEIMTPRLFLEKLLSQNNWNELPLSLNPMLNEWWDNIHSFSYLNEGLKDQKIDEIIIHGTHCIEFDINGILEVQNDLGQYLKENFSHENLQLSFEILCVNHKVKWNYSHPFASFYMTFNEHSQNLKLRATLIHYSLFPKANESKLFLRKFSTKSFSLKKFLRDIPTFEQEKYEFLHQIIDKKANILIAGTTNSGKTSLLKSLLDLISPREHVIILEDTYEIYSPSPTFTNLLAQENVEYKNLIDLCTYALRMRPDRLLLGEIRKNEIIPFFLAMNTGHLGLMSTIHANSARDALSRCALLMNLFCEKKEISYAIAMDLICQNLHYVIFMANKKIVDIIKVLGSDQGRPLIERVFIHQQEQH